MDATRIPMKQPDETYEMGRKLGEGGAAVVYEARHKVEGILYAVKSIRKGAKVMEDFKQADILKVVDHPNIILLKEIFQSPTHYFLVMELARGGELFDRIIKAKRFSEKDAANVIRRIASALKHMHTRNIAHCDLKPENILYTTPNDDAEIKIADFGFAGLTDDDTLLRRLCGTPQYVAPEILRRQGYGCPVDCWSLGVILYIMLCGFPPFYGEQHYPEPQRKARMQEKILSGRYKFLSPYWDNISDSAKDLVRQLLKTDPATRFTARQVEEHPWIMGGAPEVDSNVMRVLEANANRQSRSEHQLAAIMMKAKDTSAVVSLAVDSNNAELLQEGGIQPAVSMMLSDDAEQVCEGCMLIAKFADSGKFRDIVEKGGLKAMVKLVKTPATPPSALVHISRAMYKICLADSRHQIAFVDHGGLLALNILTKCSKAVQEQAANSLANLAFNLALQEEVMKEPSVVLALMGLTTSDFDEHRANAKTAVVLLCANEKYCIHIVKWLCEKTADLMDTSDLAALSKLACTVSDLTLTETNQAMLIRCGMLTALGRLLDKAVDVGATNPSEQGPLFELHTANACGNLAPALAEMGHQVSAAYRDQLTSLRAKLGKNAGLQLLFCVQWAANQFDPEPSQAAQGVMLDVMNSTKRIKLSCDGLQARNDSFSFDTAVATHSVTRGRWYYEVHLVTAGTEQNPVRLGWAWADAQFDADAPFVVGSDELSFAYEGAMAHKWNGPKYQAFGSKWHAGQTVGCWIDVADTVTVGFTLDGVDLLVKLKRDEVEAAPDMQNIAFRVPNRGDGLGLAPAISLGRFQQVETRFAEAEWKFPRDGFLPVPFIA